MTKPNLGSSFENSDGNFFFENMSYTILKKHPFMKLFEKGRLVTQTVNLWLSQHEGSSVAPGFVPS